MSSIISRFQFLNEFLEVNPKIFLLVGHMSLSDEFDKCKFESGVPFFHLLTGIRSTGQIIHDAIRKRHPHTPIFIFGGKWHA